MAKNYIEFELRPNVPIGEFVRKFNALEGEARQAFLDASTVQPKPVTQKVTLQAELNETGFKSAVALTDSIKKNSEQLSTFINNANKLQDGSVAKLKQQLAQATQVRNEIARYETSMGGVAAIVRSVNPLWTEQNNRVKLLRAELDKASASSFWDRLKVDLNFGAFEKFGGVVNGLVNTFQSLGIIFGQIIAPINDVIDTLGKLEGIDLTLRAIGQGPAEVATVFQNSTDIATKYGVSLNAVREGFVKLSPTVIAAGGNLQDVTSVMGALSSRFAAFGLSADQANRVMNGVIQAFGKGKLQAEELNQQISEADPAFRVDFAEALKKAQKELGSLGNEVDGTVANLNELVKEGKITSDVLLLVLPYTEKLSSAFGKLGPTAESALQAFAKGQATVKQVTTQLQNLNQLNFETLAKSVRPLAGIFLQLQAIAIDTFAVFLKSDTFKALVTVLTDLAGGIVFVINALVKLGTAFAAILDPVIGALNAINSLIPVTKALGVILGGYLALSVFNLAKVGIPLLIASIQALIAAKAQWAVAALAVSNRGLIPLIAGAGRLAGATKGLATTGITALAGAFKSGLLPTLTSFAARIRGAVLPALSSLSVGAATATSGLGSVSTIGSAVASALGGAAPSIASAASKYVGLGKNAKTASAGVKAAGNAVAETATDIAVNAAAGAAGSAAYDKLANSGKNAANAAAKTGQQFKITGDVLEGTNAATSKGAIQWAKYARGGAIALAALATLGVGYAVYNQVTQSSTQISTEFSQALKTIKTDLDNTRQSLKPTGSDLEQFIAILNGFKLSDNYNDSITNFLEGLKISGAVDALKKGKEDINKTFADITKQLKEYNAATATDRSTANVQAGVKAKVQAYDALIQSNIKVRNELAKKIQDRGFATPENIERLKKYAREIDALRQERQKFINEAGRKGISLTVEITKKEEFAGSIEDVKADIKALETERAGIPIGFNQEKRQQLAQQINGIKQTLQLLEDDPVLIKAEVGFKVQMSDLKNAVELGKAYADKIKAALELEQSQFTLIRSSVDYKVTAAEKELEALRERNAGEDVIKAKEQEIKQLKEEAFNIDTQALQAKAAGLAQTQAAERASLLLTQQMRALELDIAAIRAKADQAAAQAALARYEQKLKEAAIEANKDGKINEEELQRLQYLKQLVDASKLAVNLRGQEYDAIVRTKTALGEQNRLEQEALGYKQQAEQNTMEAALRQRGVTTEAGKSAAAIGNVANATRQVSAGFIEVAGKVVTLTNTINAKGQVINTFANTGAAAGQKIGTSFGQASSKISDAGAAATTAGQQVNASLAGMSQAATSAAEGANSLGGSLNGAATAAGNIAGAAQSIYGPLGQATQAATGLPEALEGASTAAGDIQGPLEASAGAIRPLEEGLSGVESSFGAAADAASGLGNVMPDVATAAAAASTNIADLPRSLEDAQTAADKVRRTLNSMDGTTIRVNVAYSGGLPGYWTGGPVSAGKLIRVNELGKEAFLSNSGKLSMINRPRNATFRPPSSGTIIPAHITQKLDIPRNGIKVSRNASSRISRASNGNSSMAALARTLAGAIRSMNQPTDIRKESSRAEAAQAAQLGRLHNAINRLSEKNWNVNVNLRNTGSTGYLDALNRSL